MADPKNANEGYRRADVGFSEFYERLRRIEVTAMNFDTLKIQLTNFSIVREQQIEQIEEELRSVRNESHKKITEFQKIRRYSSDIDGIISSFENERTVSDRLMANRTMKNLIVDEAMGKLLVLSESGLKQGWEPTVNAQVTAKFNEVLDFLGTVVQNKKVVLTPESKRKLDVIVRG